MRLGNALSKTDPQVGLKTMVRQSHFIIESIARTMGMYDNRDLVALDNWDERRPKLPGRDSLP